MGERLAWARNQQGLTLHKVSDSSGLAIGYISQLEKGTKVNPTLSALQRLAKALCVTEEFILGKVEAPDTSDIGTLLLSSQTAEIGQRFADHLRKMGPEKQRSLTGLTVQKRLAIVVEFLCSEYPERFTRPVLAFQLGLSLRALNDILEEYETPGMIMLKQLSGLTGIPLEFFAAGTLRPAPKGQRPVSMDEILRFTESIRTAIEYGISPLELTALIKKRMDRR
jgi:transcriptional regulator with XRE-family HTH domain